MPNSEHLKIVKRGAEAIAKWRKEHPEEQLDLSEAELSQADLREADLSDANLSGANLIGANLSSANLSGANLSFADLSSANLSFADLSSADLGEADLQRADLSHADISWADVQKADLSHADLSWADVQKADLSHAELSEAKLSGANLAEASLDNAELRNATLFRATLFRATLFRATLFRTNLGQAVLNGANFIEATLQATDLSGAKLRGANLAEASLRDSTFSNADLSKADLTSADLSGADLGGTNLLGADLYEANLHEANLPKANLQGASLHSARLHGCIVDGTVFSDAQCCRTTFDDLDLSLSIGLESCNHRAPSTIGVDTLYKSKGKIPEAFLRGCGVPENLIDYLLSLTNQAINFYSCFISYSHKDEEFCQRLHSRLRQEKLRVWYAPEDLAWGKKMHEEIDRAIRVHDKLLLVLSDESMNSEWVATEIYHARQREKEEKKQILFPIRLVAFDSIRKWESFDADTGKDMAREIREYNIPDFSNWMDHDSFEENFAKLLGYLKAETSAK